METSIRPRPRTVHFESDPPDMKAEDLNKCFFTEDKPHLKVRSMVPAVGELGSIGASRASPRTFFGSVQEKLSSMSRWPLPSQPEVPK